MSLTSKHRVSAEVIVISEMLVFKINGKFLSTCLSNPESRSHLHVHTCRRLCTPLSQLFFWGERQLGRGASLLAVPFCRRHGCSTSMGSHAAPCNLDKKAPRMSPTCWGWVSHACCTLYHPPTSWVQPPQHACPRQRWWCWWDSVTPAFGSCCLHENALTGNFSYPKTVAHMWMPSWL